MPDRRSFYHDCKTRGIRHSDKLTNSFHKKVASLGAIYADCKALFHIRPDRRSDFELAGPTIEKDNAGHCSGSLRWSTRLWWLWPNGNACDLGCEWPGRYLFRHPV